MKGNRTFHDALVPFAERRIISMKKKIMAVILCLAMVSTFVVGCGQKKETDLGKSAEKSSGKVEIEFVQVKREAAESYTKVIEAFQKKKPRYCH